MAHRGRPAGPPSTALTGIHFQGLHGQRRARSMTSFKSRSAVARVVASCPARRENETCKGSSASVARGPLSLLDAG